MKLHERLGLGIGAVGLEVSLEMLQIVESAQATTHYDIAWNKFRRARYQGLVALKYYILAEQHEARRHGKLCLERAEDFFHGSWRDEFIDPDGKHGTRWLQEKFDWMEVFRECLLWGSALGEWRFLKHCSGYPEKNACLSEGYTAQDRDALVAISVIVSGDQAEKSSQCINRAADGPRKGCRLLTEVLISLVNGKINSFEEGFISYLKHYKKTDFPKEQITKKVSVEGTFLAHWARHHGMKVEVPSQFEDHIVKFPA